MEVHQFTDLAYTHLSFIARNASGLPSPSQTLFPRAGDSLTGLSGGGNCSTIAVSQRHSPPGPPQRHPVHRAGRPQRRGGGQAQEAQEDTNFNDHFKHPVAVFGYQLTTLAFHELDFLDYQPFPAHVDK
jgi:hypothetical protein